MTSTGQAPWFMALLTGICAVTGVAGWLVSAPAWEMLSWSLFALSYLAGAWSPAQQVFQAFLKREIDVNFLMLLAALGAASIGEVGEGAVLLFLFSLSGALEKFTLERTARSIEALVELRPDTATLVRDGLEVKVPIESIQPGDLIRVVPAERLGVDGSIVEGQSSLDESTLTGESIPLEKGPGQEVFAGTLNHRGTLLVRVSRTSSETMLAKIVRLVREARDERTLLERQVERWQRPYVFAVLAGSAAAVAIPILVFGHDFNAAFYHGMVFLVAASPCAVMVSTPAAVLAGITRAARQGVLFKGGAYLERLAHVRALAMDKTGTVTYGKPDVVALYEPSGNAQPLAQLLARAASVEHHSEHALGQAVVAEAARQGLAPQPVTEFESHVALGVHALVSGVWVGVGTEELLTSHGHAVPPALVQKGQELRLKGVTALWVFCDDGLCGVIGIADRVREEAAGTLARLRQMGIRKVVILTGDHETVGRAVAQAVGADESRCSLKPIEKVAELKRLLSEFGAVAYVGDGVNDAPALAAASVGVAMGGVGTDVALDTADLVLMRNDLRGLLFSIWLSQRTGAAIRRGLTIAFSVIAVLVVNAVLGIVPLWIAVLCHEGSTVLAIFNGLYLLVEREPQTS